MYQVAVFISHSWKYTGHYETLAKWIFKEQWNINGTPISFHDKSIPQDDPIHNARNAEELKQRIFNEISQCAVVVCPTGMYSSHSNWIGKELVGARQLGVPILAVNPWGQERKSLTVAQHANRTVGWNKQSVIDGVWEIRRT